MPSMVTFFLGRGVSSRFKGFLKVYYTDDLREVICDFERMSSYVVCAFF